MIPILKMRWRIISKLAEEEHIARALTPQAPRREALLRHGNVQHAREQQRASRGLPWIGVLSQDLRFNLRTSGRDRAYAAIAVLILALRMGANIVVFSFVETILLRPLPFPPDPAAAPPSAPG